MARPTRPGESVDFSGREQLYLEGTRRLDLDQKDQCDLAVQKNLRLDPETYRKAFWPTPEVRLSRRARAQSG